MAEPSRRAQLIAQALEDLASFRMSDLLHGVTAEGLAASSSRSASPISASAVRYHFGRDGSQAFDREDLARGLAITALDELIGRLASWTPVADQQLEAEVVRLLRLRPGAGPRAAILLALAASRDEAHIAGRLEELHRTLVAALEQLVAADLDASRRRPAGGASSLEVARSVASLVEAGLVGTALVLDGSPELLATTVSDLVAGLSESAAGDDAIEPRSGVDPQERVTALERRLDRVGAESDEGLRLVTELLAHAPGGTWVFGRLRTRAERLLAQPKLRTTPAGQRAWLAAAGLLCMADGNRELADEVATTGLRTLALEPTHEAIMEGIRTGWLLVRLDRFEEALEQLERMRRLATGHGFHAHVAFARAVEAHARCSVGPLDVAMDMAHREASPEPTSPVARLGASWGAASAIRACVLAGSLDGAERQLGMVAESDEQPDLGATMLLLSRGILDVARGRPDDALASLVRVRDRHRRAGVENTAGWPWLAPMTQALVELDRRAQARDVIDGVSATVSRWGTDTVRAELLRARALVETDTGARRQALTEAGRVLDESPAAVDRALVAGALAALPLRGTALTPRVRQAAVLAAAGNTNAQIAGELGIAATTVARHISSALRATGSRNRTELARRIDAPLRDAER